MERKLWQNTTDFSVSTRTSRHKWSVSTKDMLALPISWFSFLTGGRRQHHTTTSAEEDKAIATDYVPQWTEPHLLKWRGCWIDVCTTEGSTPSYHGDTATPGTLNLT